MQVRFTDPTPNRAAGRPLRALCNIMHHKTGVCFRAHGRAAL